MYAEDGHCLRCVAIVAYVATMRWVIQMRATVAKRGDLWGQ